MDDPLKAAITHFRRQDRTEHPDGKFDGPRWYPSDTECQPCCSGIRSPSRAFPWSLMVHCRTIEHVAYLSHSTPTDVRRVVKWLRDHVNPDRYDALETVEIDKYAWGYTDRYLKAVLDVHTLISGGQVIPLTARKMECMEIDDIVKLAVTCWPDTDLALARMYAEALTTGVMKAGSPVAGWLVELTMVVRAAA